MGWPQPKCSMIDNQFHTCHACCETVPSSRTEIDVKKNVYQSIRCLRLMKDSGVVLGQEVIYT